MDAVSSLPSPRRITSEMYRTTWRVRAVTLRTTRTSQTYLTKLFEGTNESTDNFSKEKALKISNGLTDSADFAERMNLAATSDILRRDIDLAEKLKIRATPTLFYRRQKSRWCASARGYGGYYPKGSRLTKLRIQN